MSDPDSSVLLSLLPHTSPDSSSLPVSTLISRIQQQRGHFRDINESLLESEISQSQSDSLLPPDQDGALTSTSDSMDLDPTLPEAPNPDDSPAAAKLKMLTLAKHAHNEALLALDYISLLVSLHSPEVGAVTMSPALRSAAPIGSLGTDKVTLKPPKGAAEEDLAITRATKVRGLRSGAEMLVKAAKKLDSEVEREKRYWGEILKIREEGWTIARMRGEKGVLGVRYGFGEAAPEFRDKGISALRMAEDGSVKMDDVDTGGKVLGVKVMRGQETLGQSVHNVIARKMKAEGELEGEESIRDKIELARNFIYDDELFFEIVREARMLAAHGIRATQDGVSIDLEDGKKLIISMVALDDPSAEPDLSSPDSSLSQAVAVALRILLSHNHRQHFQKRTQPPPPLTPSKPRPPPLQLLRPIATHLHHHGHTRTVTATLRSLVRFSTTAGFSASFVFTPLATSGRQVITDVTSVVTAFLPPVESSAVLRLPGQWVVHVSLTTDLTPTAKSANSFAVRAAHDGSVAPLMGDERFYAVEELQAKLRWCLERAVVKEVVSKGEWEQEGVGTALHRVKGKGKARVMVGVDAVGLRVTWGGAGGRDESFVWDGTEKGKKLRGLLGSL